MINWLISSLCFWRPGHKKLPPVLAEPEGLLNRLHYSPEILSLPSHTSKKCFGSQLWTRHLHSDTWLLLSMVCWFSISKLSFLFLSPFPSLSIPRSFSPLQSWLIHHSSHNSTHSPPMEVDKDYRWFDFQLIPVIKSESSGAAYSLSAHQRLARCLPRH